MILQLSSGQGPAECELGVALLMDALKKEGTRERKREVTVPCSFVPRRISPFWREVYSGSARVHTVLIIPGRTGIWTSA